MPTDPASYESEDDWMEACVPKQLDEGKDQDQAVAICMSMWREKSAKPTRRKLPVVRLDRK